MNKNTTEHLIKLVLAYKYYQMIVLLFHAYFYYTECSWIMNQMHITSLLLL